MLRAARLYGGWPEEVHRPVELEAWLEVYQAITLTASAKERAYWTQFFGFLISSALLVVAGAFFHLGFSLPGRRALQTGLATLGLCLSLGWWTGLRAAGRELALWASLLRGLEGEFAGAEFHRSAFKLLQGRQVCVPASDWKCEEWHPLVTRIPWPWRNLGRLLLGVIPLAFFMAWAAFLAAAWLV